MKNAVNYILLHAAVRMLRLMPLKPSLWGGVYYSKLLTFSEFPFTAGTNLKTFSVHL